jgi:curved DNA-binding protein CbpA
MVRVPFDPATDYYQLLGVEPQATNDEIQAAYRRLAKAYHPDLNAGSAIAAERMARVNVAKSVLLDRDTRATYDHYRGLQPVQPEVIRHANRERVTVRYAPYQAAPRPRYRVVSGAAARSIPRAGFDRGTAILLLVAVPLIAALSFYVFQAVQVSIQPLKAASADAILEPGTSNRPTARGAADAVFMMVHAQPPSRDLAVRANNFILARSDSSPDSELLRADGRRLVRAATDSDTAAWDATVADVCHIAARC